MSSNSSFEEERRRMVNQQLKPRNISNTRVLEAMKKVPREEFVPDSEKDRAYTDRALPIREGQTISQPYIVALMTQQLKVGSSEKVLEVGTGSGYQTAILAELGASIFTVEYHEQLSKKARKRLEKLGYGDQVEFKTGDGSLGWPEKSSFDRVIITAAVPSIPEPIKKQTAGDGLIVAPVGTRYSQKMEVLKKTGKEDWQKIQLIGCRFVPLLGEGGWSEDN